MALVRVIVNPNEDNEQLFELECSCLTAGTAADNDLVLDAPSISAHHFKLEQRADGWHLVDLHSRQGTRLRADAVDDARIDRGTIFTAGDVHVLFDLVKSDEPAPVESVEYMPAISHAQTGLMARATAPCWRCQRPIPPGDFCPYCGADQRSAYAPSPFVAPVESPHAPGAGLMPLVALILSILGPLLFGLGWLAGLILGFVAISIIRRRGGHLQDVRRAHFAVYIGFAWFVILSLLAAWWSFSSSTTRRIARNERAAIEQLRNIALSQTHLKLSYALDRDGDGIAEFGSLADAASNDFAHVALALADTPEFSGYRFSMLRADESDFVCTAEPLVRGVTGRRTFIIRRNGVLHGAERADDAPLRPETDLPRVDTKSVIDSYADDLVRELQQAAATALRAKEYPRAVAIIAAARERFPDSAELAKLDALADKANPFIVEIRGLELMDQASNAFAQGHALREIEILQTLRDTYPTFKSIEQVEQLLKQRRDTYSQNSERLARDLFNTAMARELQREFEQAESVYKTVINQYPDTAAARDAQRQIAVLGERAHEQAASRLLHDALSLNLDREYHDMLVRLDQLQRGYADTLAVSQAAGRISALIQQAQARSAAADGLAAAASNDTARALAAFSRAAELDPLCVDLFATNYATALLYGVSNALVTADYAAALSLAERYQQLRINLSLLPPAQLDQIRLAMAQLYLDRHDLSNAVRMVRGLGSRIAESPALGFTAGKIFFAAGEYDKTAACLAPCLADEQLAPAARPLYIASAARAALQAEALLFSSLAAEPEWTQLARTFNFSIPGLTNIATTSTWQNLCVDLSDMVALSYDLLTYSGAEADLFLDKQQAHNELNAALRRLQRMLSDSQRTGRAAARAAADAALWWSNCHAVATSMIADTPTIEVQNRLAAFARKQTLAASAADAARRAITADVMLKRSVQTHLASLVEQLERKMPLNNVLTGMKKYLADQRQTELNRRMLATAADLASVQVDPQRIADDFSNL